MDRARAIAITGGLSTPSKMPGMSYGISATLCQVGSRLREVEGSTCSKCYARKGRYVFQNVVRSHERRFQGLNHPEWVEAMAFLINQSCQKEPYFRWHDSGDLQGLWHLENIAQVCVLTPRVKHWLPTREIQIVQTFLRTRQVPDNLTIRISAHMIDGRPPQIGLPTSTVSRRERPQDSHVCPAPTQNNHCGSCRSCWDAATRNVDYHLH